MNNTRFLKGAVLIMAALICILCGVIAGMVIAGKKEPASAPESGTQTAVQKEKEESGNSESSKESQQEQEKEPETELPSAAGGEYYGALQVKGASLCDSKGNPVQLRGVSTHGLAWFPQYVNAKLVKELHEKWNANVIRLAMYTAENGGYCTDGNKNDLKKLIDDGVNYAAAENMYVIIDWHILSDNNPNTNKKEAKKFFREMSEKYADYDNVIYEICNEPNGDTTWKDIKSYAEEMIPVIRKNDKNAVILVGTPNWSQYVNEAAADPIKGQENIMYTLHFYAATHKEELRNTLKAAYEAGLPVFVSEYGICEASGNGMVDVESANEWMKLLDSCKISHVAWNLANKEEASSMFLPSCTKTDGFTRKDLSDGGKWIYAMLTGDKKAMEEEPSGVPEGIVQIKTSDKNLKAALTVSGSWENDGKKVYQYRLSVSNKSGETADGWKVEIQFENGIELSDNWNGKFKADGKKLTVKPVDYNKKIDGNAAVSDIGFTVMIK